MKLRHRKNQEDPLMPLPSPRRGSPWRATRLFICMLLGLLTSAHAVAEPLLSSTAMPGGFVADVVASNLQYPTAFVRLPDGRLLITEKSGVVRVFKDGALLPTPFIDISERVNAYQDR